MASSDNDRKFNLFLVLCVVAFAAGAGLFGYIDNNKTAACRKACHPDAYKRIDSVCHCGIEGGWRRSNE